MPKTHYFPEDQVHYVWDNELAPALTVEPGDPVVYHTREVSDGQATHRTPRRTSSPVSTGSASTRSLARSRWRAPNQAIS